MNIIGGVFITDEIQSKINYNYSLGILNYLHKSGIIDCQQLQMMIKLQDDKLQKINNQQQDKQRKEVA